MKSRTAGASSRRPRKRRTGAEAGSAPGRLEGFKALPLEFLGDLGDEPIFGRALDGQAGDGGQAGADRSLAAAVAVDDTVAAPVGGDPDRLQEAVGANAGGERVQVARPVAAHVIG